MTKLALFPVAKQLNADSVCKTSRPMAAILSNKVKCHVRRN